MSDLIKDNLASSISNDKVGRAIGVTEATIRNMRKNPDQTEYLEAVQEAKFKLDPFVTLEEYNSFYGTTYNENEVLDKKLPGIINLAKEGGVLLPTTLDKILNSKRKLSELGQRGITISFSNFKGGVGKTSVSINVGITLSLFGFKVLIVDADKQSNTTSMFDITREKKRDVVDLDIKKIEDIYDLEKSDFKYTIVDLMTDIEKDNIEQMIKDSIVNINDKTKTIGQIDIIPNSSDIENILKFEDIGAALRNYGNPNKALDEVLSYVREDYDFIIIDTPPDVALPLRMSVLATDYFIIVLTADKMAKDGIAPFLVPIEMHKKIYKKEKGKDIVVLGGVLNKFTLTNVQKVNKELIHKSLLANTTNADLGEAGLFDTVIKNLIIMNEAQYKTGSILVYKPTAEIVRDFFDLILEIIEKITLDIMSKK